MLKRVLLLLSILILCFKLKGQKTCSVEKLVYIQFGQICLPKKHRPEFQPSNIQTLNYHPKLKHIPIKRLKQLFKFSIEKGVNIFFKNLIFTINKKFFWGVFKFILDVVFKTTIDLFSKFVSLFISHVIIKVLILGLQKKFKILLFEVALDNFLKAGIEITL